MNRFAVNGARAVSRCAWQTQPILTQRMVRRADVKVCTYTSASRSCLAWSSSTSDPSTQGLLSDIRGIFDKGQEPQPEKGGDADLKEEEHEEYYPTKGRPVVRRDIHKLDQIPPDMVWRCLDSTKQALYEMYLESDGKASIMELANHFQLNPHRVKAIIRHMQIRDEQRERVEREAEDSTIPEEKKFKMFWDLEREDDERAYKFLNSITGMYGPPRHVIEAADDYDEDDSNAPDASRFEFDEFNPFSRPEPLIFNMTHSSNPAFRVISDEEVEKFYSRIAEEALQEDITLVRTETISPIPAMPLRNDPEIKTRAKIVFTDTSRGANSEERDIRIREKDGSLRSASGEEHKQIEKKIYPSKRNTRLF